MPARERLIVEDQEVKPWQSKTAPISPSGLYMQLYTGMHTFTRVCTRSCKCVPVIQAYVQNKPKHKLNYQDVCSLQPWGFSASFQALVPVTRMFLCNKVPETVDPGHQRRVGSLQDCGDSLPKWRPLARLSHKSEDVD